jgi:hypothetical protein
MIRRFPVFEKAPEWLALPLGRVREGEDTACYVVGSCSGTRFAGLRRRCVETRGLGRAWGSRVILRCVSLMRAVLAHNAQAGSRATTSADGGRHARAHPKAAQIPLQLDESARSLDVMSPNVSLRRGGCAA